MRNWPEGPIRQTNDSEGVLPDSEMDEGEPDEEEFVLEIVEVLHSDTERRLDNALCAFSCSSRRLR